MNRRIGNVAVFIVMVTLTAAGHATAQNRGRGQRAPTTPPSSSSTFVLVPNPATTPGLFTDRAPAWRARRSFVFPQPYLGFYAPYVAPVSPYIAAPISPEPVYLPVPSVPAQRESELSAEVQRLSRQVEELRQEQALAPPATPLPPQPVSAPAAQSTPSTPKVLIFRDGRRSVFYNYMVSSETLWISDPGNSTRIPLADLDLEAMEKENSGRGLRLLQR
jgi:hypothetical protein